MPEFHYTATGKDDHLVRGTLDVADKHALIEELQRQGLFLVTVDKPDIAQEPPLSESSIPSEPPNDLVAATRPTQRQRILVLSGILAVGLLFSCLLNYFLLRSQPIDTSLLNQQLSQIHPGMSRAQIEKILGDPTSDHSGPQRNGYFVQPIFILEIPYDQTGGVGSRRNQYRKGMITISIRSQRLQNLTPKNKA